jgi:hypothetical protein
MRPPTAFGLSGSGTAVTVPKSAGTSKYTRRGGRCQREPAGSLRAGIGVGRVVDASSKVHGARPVFSRDIMMGGGTRGS